MALEELRAATAALQALQTATAANTSAIAQLEARAVGSPVKATPPPVVLPPPRRTSVVAMPPAPEPPASTGGGYDKVSIRVTNPACMVMVSLVLLCVAFASGYLFREHQSVEEAQQFSAFEQLFWEREKTTLETIASFFAPVTDPITDALGITSGDGSTCADGLLISGPAPTRGNMLLFLALLLWTFLGVAVYADLFMLAIERITSEEVTRKIELPNGKKRIVHTFTWNATVANLTLMALGSSAPEILLSVIEVVTSGFFAGELGPSTIVGSAAFNMLCISAVCVTALPEGEGRLIRELGVFAITAVFSVLAYLWLLVILVYVSPNVIDVWEGLVTFAFFPLLVWLAFLADQGVLALPTGLQGGGGKAMAKMARTVSVRDESAFDGGGAGARASSNSKAFYRVNAVRAMSGFKSIDEASDVRRQTLVAATDVSIEQGLFADIHFFASTVTVHVEDSKVDLVIFRSGNTRGPSTVKYACSFSADKIEQVEFESGSTSATLEIQLLPEDKVVKKDGAPAFTVTLLQPSAASKLGKLDTCAVVAVEDASPGFFVLAEDMLTVDESERAARIVVKRQGGSRGVVSCEVNTKDGTAVAPNDYVAIQDMSLVFADGEVEKTVEVAIMNDGNLEGDETFTVSFTGASGGATFSNDCDGGPERAVCTIAIKGEDGSKLSGPPKSCQELAFYLGANSDEISLTTFAWSAQFSEAVDFEHGGGWMAFAMFVLSLPWKLSVAFAPPPRLLGGWACFVVVLALIGVLTAFIGDLASHMGCCMGLAPATTAITFVALGTSLPDTFASMSAATSEPYADSSIGNITGSNSVNVFLGLGLPWAIAAVYWATVEAGSETAASWHRRYSQASWYTPGMPVGFAVPAGDLGFSVMVFCMCAILCLLTLVLRRVMIGFELGHSYRTTTALFFVFLWFTYIAASVTYSS